MKIEIGEKVRVRLQNGNTADGIIDGKTWGGEFFVDTEDDRFILSDAKPRPAKGNEFYDRVRLIYPIEQMENYKAKQK